MTETIAAPAKVKPIHHWIGGKSVPSSSGRSGPVWNPATGEQSGAVDLATVEEVDAAVQTARKAFETWREVSLSRRAELFFKIRQLVHEHRADIARFLTLEHGKVTSDALGEVARGLEVIEYACGIPTLLKGEYSEQASTGIDVYSIREPLGVVAGITPFNFPAMVPMWMWAPAIACGNTFVLKPSEKDPSASLLVAELLQRAGLPEVVDRILESHHGRVHRRRPGEALLDTDPDVHGIDPNRIPAKTRDEELGAVLGFENRAERRRQLQPALFVQLRERASP